MFVVVDDFDSPSHRKGSDRNRRVFERATHHRAKLFRLPGVNLCLALFSTTWWRRRVRRSSSIGTPTT